MIDGCSPALSIRRNGKTVPRILNRFKPPIPAMPFPVTFNLIRQRTLSCPRGHCRSVTSRFANGLRTLTSMTDATPATTSPSAGTSWPNYHGLGGTFCIDLAKRRITVECRNWNAGPEQPVGQFANWPRTFGSDKVRCASNRACLKPSRNLSRSGCSKLEGFD